MSPVSNPDKIFKKEKKIKGQAIQAGKSDNPLSHFFKPSCIGSPSSSTIKGKSHVIAEPKYDSIVENFPSDNLEESGLAHSIAANSPKDSENLSTSSFESVNSEAVEKDYFEVHTNLAVIEDKVEEDEIVITSLNGFTRPWYVFIQIVCSRKEKLYFDNLWEECVQEETRVENKEANIRKDGDQALASHAKNEMGKRKDHSPKKPQGL